MPAGGKIGNKGGGRKTRGQELALVQWYESVLPRVFAVVKKKLESKKELEQLWAMDWLKTGIVKMIPQKIGGDKDNPLVNTQAIAEALMKMAKKQYDNNTNAEPVQLGGNTGDEGLSENLIQEPQGESI